MGEFTGKLTPVFSMVFIEFCLISWMDLSNSHTTSLCLTEIIFISANDGTKIDLQILSKAHRSFSRSTVIVNIFFFHASTLALIHKRSVATSDDPPNLGKKITPHLWDILPA